MEEQENITVEATEEQQEAYRKKGRLVTFAAMGELALVAAGILYMGLAANYYGLGFQIYIIVGFIVFWALSDVVRPRVAHEFDGKTLDQRKAYTKMALFEFLGYAGLVYFCLAINSNSGFYGVILYCLSSVMKRRFRDEFNRDPAQTSDGENADERAADGSIGSLLHLRTAKSGSTQDESVSPAKRSMMDIASLSTADIEEREEGTGEAVSQSDDAADN